MKLDSPDSCNIIWARWANLHHRLGRCFHTYITPLMNTRIFILEFDFFRSWSSVHLPIGEWYTNSKFERLFFSDGFYSQHEADLIHIIRMVVLPMQLRNHLCARTAVSCAPRPPHCACAYWRSSPPSPQLAWSHPMLLYWGNYPLPPHSWHGVFLCCST